MKPHLVLSEFLNFRFCLDFKGTGGNRAVPEMKRPAPGVGRECPFLPMRRALDTRRSVSALHVRQEKLIDFSWNRANNVLMKASWVKI